MIGHPTSSPNARSASASTQCRQAGAGASNALVNRSRINSLSWACCSASGPGRTRWPSACSARRMRVGTCSWSKVITSQSAAKARSVASSV